MNWHLRKAVAILLTLSHLPISFARRRNGFRHEPLDAPRGRHVIATPVKLASVSGSTSGQCPVPTSMHHSILSIVFPSLDASPVEITSQSQVVESYIPDITWCVGPPIGLIPTATLTGAPYLNDSTLYTTTTAGTGSCETVYVPTTTTVCATTLIGLASKITVSECDQEITFSSEWGFTLETPTLTTNNISLITPAPTVKRMMTYWLVPWQSLTLGETPSNVDIKVCTILEDETLECIRYQEVWEVVIVTKTITTQRQIQVATTLSGPGTLIVETMQAYITDTIAFVNLTTTLLLQTEIEIETTSKSKKLVTRPETDAQSTSTKYVTKLVKYKSPLLR